MGCLQVMEHELHLVVHMCGPRKVFLYLDWALGFYTVDAANSSCNLQRVEKKRFISLFKLCFQNAYGIVYRF